MTLKNLKQTALKVAKALLMLIACAATVAALVTTLWVADALGVPM